MSIALRRFRADEYTAWEPRSRERYADDMVRNGGVASENAETKAAQDFERILPAGLATPGQHLWMIEADGDVIGHAWLGERDAADGRRVAFVFEVWVDEEHRGHGHGRGAMVRLEDEARALGHDRIELNVFGGNAVARGLYSTLGYSEVAIYMGKDLG